MASENDRKPGEFDRVIMPRDLDYRISHVMHVIRRAVLENAARRMLAREPGDGDIHLKAEFVVMAARDVLPDASEYFDDGLKEFIQKKNVRRAS